MEQQLSYANTSDGMRIGYAVTGTAEPAVLFIAPPIHSHALLWPRLPQPGSLVNRLSRVRRFAWVDLRGTGTSSRNVPDFSLEAYAEDVRAVAREMGLKRYDLLAQGIRAPIAVHLAVAHRDEVRSLILWMPALKDVGWQSGTRPLRISDYDTYLRVTAGQFLPRDDVEESANRMQRSVNQADLVGALDAFLGYDIAGDLPGIECPTLFITGTDPTFDLTEAAAEAAEIVPNSELVVVGPRHDPEAYDRAIEVARAFLSRESVPAAIGLDIALSPREIEVLALLAAGRSNKEIAGDLTLSLPTVATHVRHILDKTGAPNRAAASAWAIRNGLA